MKRIFAITQRIKRKILASLLITSLTLSQGFATGGAIVFDPTTYASILESIEKYNSMIKNMEETLDTMNRINDVMNTASNQLNNLQTGLANPANLIDRFQSNLQGIQDNFNRISNNLKHKDWKNSIIKTQYAECSKRWQKLRQKYPEAYRDNPIALEIDANTKWMEAVNNDGLIKANDNINQYFDKVINKMDITDIEAKISKTKDPKQTAIYICEMIRTEELKKRIDECLREYHKAVQNKDLKKASEAMQCVRKTREELLDKQIEPKRDLNKFLTTTPTFKIQKNDEAILQLDPMSGNYNPNAWKTYSCNNEADCIETKTIETKDSEGNRKSVTLKVAKQDTIKNVYDKGAINEAINLQNQRNMALVLAGDSYALEQAQLETLQMISTQILTLNDSLNAIGQIAQKFLENDLRNDESELNSLKSNHNDAMFNQFTQSLQDHQPSYEYNEFGMPVRKPKQDDIVGGGDMGGEK